MCKIEITKTADTVSVVSPYNENFISDARKLGGKYSGSAWVFDIRDEARVREACFVTYGDDGFRKEHVTLRIKWIKEGSQGCGPITRNGRVIAKASGRDSGARLGNGVVVLSGGFSSGGSVKNWVTTAREGTEVLVREFPKAYAEKLVGMESEKCVYSIEPEEVPVDREALRRELDVLKARVAEIEGVLASGA